jgi:hypothetical protein
MLGKRVAFAIGTLIFNIVLMLVCFGVVANYMGAPGVILGVLSGFVFGLSSLDCIFNFKKHCSVIPDSKEDCGELNA